MLLTTERVLKAYIKTGTQPSTGLDSHNGGWTDDAEHPTCACPIGAVCLDLGTDPRWMDSTSLYEHLSPEGNGPWVDGFTAGWEDIGSPDDHNYTAEHNPDGLALYREGHQNGKHIRHEFISLGFSLQNRPS